MTRISSATIADVARKAGVSTATVSRLLNGIGPISEETEERVRSAIRELNYRPKRKRRARGEANSGDGKSPASRPPLAFLKIGAFESQDRSPVTEHLVESLHRGAYALGRNLSVHQVPELNGTNIRDIIGDAEGVILRTSNIREVTSQAVEWLQDVPAVQVLGENHLGRLLVDHVAPDNVQAGALAAEYLMKQGSRRLIFAVPNVQNCSVAVERCLSFVHAARKEGKEVHVLVQSIQDSDGRLEKELSGLSADMKVCESRMDLVKGIASLAKDSFGLFVPTDLELAMLMPQLQMAGVDFQKGGHVIGCDHETRVLSGLDPLPATLDLHLENIAARALRRLMYRISYPREPLVRIAVAPDIVLPENLMTVEPVSDSALSSVGA